MNTKKLEKLRFIAKRTLKILELIEEGKTSQEIVEALGVNRSLVDYYIKSLKNN